MGGAILYCYRCNTQLREAQFEQGKAYRIDTRACCADCAPAAVRELPPDRVQGLLDQLRARSAPRPQEGRPRPAKRESHVMAVVPPRPPSTALPWIVAGVAGVIAFLALVFLASGGPPAPPSRPAPPPAAPAAKKPAAETPAQTALRKALAFAESRPSDLAGQIREFETALFACEGSPQAAECRSRLLVARAALKELLERDLLALERDLEEPVRGEAFARAFRILDSAKSRHADAQWTFHLEKRLRGLKTAVETAFGHAREKALDAKARGADADVEAVLLRLGRWELPEWTERLKADLAQVLTQLTLETFDELTPGWKYVGGEEFPGAKGSLTIDTQVKRGGRASFRVNADFGSGGAYVGLWFDVGRRLGDRDVKELRLWVKTSTRPSLGIRLADGTGQVHQRHVDLPGGADGRWQELVLRIADLVGGERWGGANDGKWHGPIRGLGINIGRSVPMNEKDPTPAEVWFDDLQAVLAEPERPR